MQKSNLIYRVITAAIFIALEIAAITMLNNNGPLQRTWLAKIGHGFMSGIWGTTQDIKDYFSLRKQNEKLAQENYELMVLLAQARQQELADSLEFETPETDSTGRFRYTPSSIAKISNNSQHNYLILDKGAEDGIEEGNGVITRQGAIGVIDAVSENYSYARSFKNHEMSLSARLGKNGSVGTLIWNGRNGALLREIPHHVDVHSGDTIYTSGYSAIFPPGIPLGVTGTARIVNGATYEINITLLEDFKSLRHVIIVSNIGRKEINGLEESR